MVGRNEYDWSIFLVDSPGSHSSTNDNQIWTIWIFLDAVFENIKIIIQISHSSE